MERRDAHTALKEKVVEKIIEGKRQLVVWGLTPSCLQLLSELHQKGLLDRVAGVVDSDPRKQGQTIHHLTVVAPEEIKKLAFDILVIASDEKKETILRQFAAIDQRTPEVVLSGSKHYAFRNSLFEDVISSSPVRSIAGGYPLMLTYIFQCLEYLVRSRCDGVVAEFGVFQGGTLTIIAKTLRKLGWTGKIYGFDLFESRLRGIR